MRAPYIILPFVTLLLLNSCQNRDITIDPSAKMVEGYIVGFNQCAIGQGFIITTISPADTMEVFNLPDSLYHFPTDAKSDIYRNYIQDFLFPIEYENKFPIKYSFEIVPEGERRYVVCLDQLISYYTQTVKKQIKIKSVTK